MFFLLLYLYDVLVLLELSLHVHYLLVLREKLLVHVVHRYFAILSLGLEIVDLPIQVFDLYPLLVELALVLSYSYLVVLLFLTDYFVYAVFLLLQLLHVSVTLF